MRVPCQAVIREPPGSSLKLCCLKFYPNSFPYLFDDAVPLLMANTHVHMLLVEELALIWNQNNVTHKLAHCKKQTKHRNCHKL